MSFQFFSEFPRPGLGIVSRCDGPIHTRQTTSKSVTNGRSQLCHPNTGPKQRIALSKSRIGLNDTASSPFVSSNTGTMVAATRNGAKAQAQARTQFPASRPTQDHDSDNGSSDESDDGIPNVSPPKPKYDPSLRSLDQRRARKRSLSNDGPTHIAQLKRQKLSNHATNHYDFGLYPTPVSSLPAQPSAEEVYSHRSVSSSAENEVPPGLLQMVNATLQHHQPIESQERPDSPGQQLLSEGILQDEDHDEVQVDGENGEQEAESNSPEHATAGSDEYVPDEEEEEHEEDQEAVAEDDDANDANEVDNIMVAAGRDEDRHTPSNYEIQHQLETPLYYGNNADAGQEKDDGTQQNIWDVPVSPSRQPLPEQPAFTGDLEGLPSPQSHIEVHIPQRGPRADTSSEVNQTGNAEVVPRRSRAKDQARLSSEPIDGYDSDNGSRSDVDLSAKESFAQDVENFRARHVGRDRNGDAVEGPPEDDDVAIHLPPTHLKKCLDEMKMLAWSGIKGDWQTRSFNFAPPSTTPGRALYSVLVKLERLYMEAPKAPHLIKQNRFLNEYSDILSHYFSQIKLVINYIATKRLKTRGRNKSSINNDRQKRREVTQDLAWIIIPMLFRVLASAWCLGGDNWRRTSFTRFTAELLTRAISWIERLYRLLITELEKKRKNQTKKSLQENEKRKKLMEPLKSLIQDLESAPDELEREECLRQLKLEERERSLKRQEEIKAQWKQEEQARLTAIKERKWRSLLSLRGYRVPRAESSIPSSPARASPALPPPATPSSSSPPRPRTVSQWSLEEQTFLFKRVQESYPKLPHLDGLRWELNKTLEDTEAMAEELLGLMLEAVEPEQAPADRAARIQEIMQDYRSHYNH
ncbi:hypothetical protein F5B20DRAFT_549223 [Whalleya microplaca]|nr:hypothetical protein F5B20DRAFT_549223 [Whalleya microplaca]